MEKFNFKKTTAKKRKYSCGGYGGTCGQCKRGWSWGVGKTSRKVSVGYSEHDVEMVLPCNLIKF